MIIKKQLTLSSWTQKFYFKAFFTQTLSCISIILRMYSSVADLIKIGKKQQHKKCNKTYRLHFCQHIPLKTQKQCHKSKLSTAAVHEERSEREASPLRCTDHRITSPDQGMRNGQTYLSIRELSPLSAWLISSGDKWTRARECSPEWCRARMSPLL